MADKKILIVGASRGIGLGLTREFLDRGWKMFATERSEGDELHKVAAEHDPAIEILTCDVTDRESYTGFRAKFDDSSLD
ncbi:MAG: SDR family NAD(P)-dependent oxidoreductase, partial [Pontixanthobacter sp.]